MSNATKMNIDFTCQYKNCIELSTHGAVVDDRWHEQSFRDGPNAKYFKPKELVIGCKAHYHNLLHRCVLGIRCDDNLFLITSYREDEWLKEIESGDLVVHGKFG